MTNYNILAFLSQYGFVLCIDCLDLITNSVRERGAHEHVEQKPAGVRVWSTYRLNRLGVVS